MKMKIHDISRPLARGIAVWPGDQPFVTRWSARIGNDSVVNVGALEMSLHSGTHADAPRHFQSGGLPIDRIPLEVFVGPALVVEVLTRGAISRHHIELIDFSASPRVLFKTPASKVPDGVWNDEFNALSIEAVDYLGDQCVRLIGVDAPSVDPADSKTLDAHHRLAARGIVNLENLSLRAVRPGRYTLVALPLPLVGMDASPVRAVLVEEPA